MLNNLTQMEPHDYEGQIFIGTVVANNDPDRIERIKVRVPNLYESDNLDLLPWIAPLQRGPIPNRPGQYGSFGLVPPVNSKVFVVLQKGDPLFPLYVGSPIERAGPVADAGVNYPNRYGFRDPAGNRFYVDTTSGQNTVFFRHNSGTSFVINNDGSITLHAVAKITSDAPEWEHTGPIIHNGQMTHNGNTEQTGTQHSTGTITSDTDCIGDGVSLHNHTHGGIDPGFGNTAPPN